MLDQLRSVDKSRLRQKIESIDSKIMDQLEEALKITFTLFAKISHANTKAAEHCSTPNASRNF